MQVAKIAEGQFTEACLAKGYLLTKYLGKKQDEFLFYWKDSLNVNTQNLLELDLIPFCPQEEVKVLTHTQVFHIVGQLLNKEPIICSLLKQWLIDYFTQRFPGKKIYSLHSASLFSVFYVGITSIDIEEGEKAILEWISLLQKAYNQTYFSYFEKVNT